MTDLDDVIRTLEEHPDRWPIAADWLDDHTHAALAYAVRWAGARGKRPRVRAAGGPAVAWTHATPDAPHALPTAVYWLLMNDSDPRMRLEVGEEHLFTTVTIAWTHLARALARLRELTALAPGPSADGSPGEDASE